MREDICHRLEQRTLACGTRVTFGGVDEATAGLLAPLTETRRAHSLAVGGGWKSASQLLPAHLYAASGEACTVDQRLEETLHRYAPGSIVHTAISKAEPLLRSVVQRSQDR